MGTPRAFEAIIRKVDINPYVRVPVAIVVALRAESSKASGAIPVKGTLQGRIFAANVVRFRGMWRLYLNGTMRAAAKADVGDSVTVILRADASPRRTPAPPAFTAALARDAKARKAFEALAPYRRKEILRYLGGIKLDATLKRNVSKAIAHLRGEKVTGLVAVTG